jgi:hypothetical protein
MEMAMRKLLALWRLKIALLLAIVSGLSALVPQTTSAQTIHAIMAGDTRDRDIGPGAARNIERFADLFAEIGSLPGWKSNIKRLVDNDFSCETILASYRSIQPAEGDLIVFYYAGHGFRLAGQQSQFPRLLCQLSVGGTPMLEDLAMAPWSKTMKPRMVLALADACNNEIGKSPEVTMSAAGKATRQQALIKLFATPKNTLIMSGSDMGQYSFYYPSGGVFSKKLVDALEDEFEKGSAATWGNVIAQSTMPEQIEYEGRYHIQRPIALSSLLCRDSKQKTIGC